MPSDREFAIEAVERIVQRMMISLDEINAVTHSPQVQERTEVIRSLLGTLVDLLA